MDVSIRICFTIWACMSAGGLLTVPQTASAQGDTTTSYLTLQVDPENCLSCHQFRGLSRVEPETGELRLFFCSATYYAERRGPHARLRCTGCHSIDEVTVIPHQVKTPVDCTRTCHLVPSSGIEIRFSHQGVADSLERSAHAPEMLAGLEFDSPLLRPGQSMCLYCHDEPQFRLPVDMIRPIGCGGPTSRCENCHLEEMPADVPYYTHHIAARLRPARTMMQLAQACAVCHSNPDIIEDMDSHDTVASYLHSFHGKANLLGSTETATCIDCHASHNGDVHAMLSAANPRSSVHVDMRVNTCRTSQCHANAAPGMSKAAVHLDLDPHRRTPEFYVAAFFVALTAAVMSIFFLLLLLELFNIVVRRHGPEYRRLIHLANVLRDHPEGRKLLERLSPHERAQHWALAITFLLLVLTGMPIKFAEAGWAQSTIEIVGGLSAARNIHRICGVAMMLAFAYHLGFLLTATWRRRARLRKEDPNIGWLGTIADARTTLRPRDFMEFGQLFAYLLFLRKERPRFRHFTFLEKFEYWAVFWGIPIMGLSGLALWGSAGIAEYVPGRVLNFAYIIHSDEAYLATVYIAVVHFFSVLFAPAVFPLSLASITGQAPAGELVEGHRESLEQAARRLGITVTTPPDEENRVAGLFRGLVRRVYAASLFGVVAVIGFASMKFLMLLLFTRQTAPVEVVEIPKRLHVDMLRTATYAASGHHATDAPARGPLAHFHQIPNWFQPDPGNTCATSGCHAPLPHGQRIEVRAFLNMHSTFVDCVVCHVSPQNRPDDLKWLSLEDRQPQRTPALLRLASLLEENRSIPEEQAAAINRDLLALLREAVKDGADAGVFGDWILRLETTHPRSEVWQSAVAEIRTRLALHTHGEYNAKIGVEMSAGRGGQFSDNYMRSIERYLEDDPRLSEADRKGLLGTIHMDIHPAGLMCAPCHSGDSKIISYEALGYPQRRIQSLEDSVIVSQILRIEKGEPFQLPRIEE